MTSSICHGRPCIRGLRYPVEMILELLSSGMSSEDILADYEDLEREDILAALAFAARLLSACTRQRDDEVAERRATAATVGAPIDFI